MRKHASGNPWMALASIEAWSRYHKEEARTQLRGTMRLIHEEAKAATDNARQMQGVLVLIAEGRGPAPQMAQAALDRINGEGDGETEA